jgi:NADH:ubiquinone oxidoreductase subunit 5 (subunit L)/multisubunit Na+/H+ antiporter MnhA subunit
MYLLIIFLPLIGTIVSGLFGSKVGTEGAKQITISCILLTFLISCFAFYEVALCGSPCYIELFTWIDSEMFSLS